MYEYVVLNSSISWYFWVYMGMYGYVWLYIGMYGYLEACLGIYMYVWVYKEKYKLASL